MRPEVSLEEWCSGRDPDARARFDEVWAAVATIGPATVRATKRQVAFRRRIAFAWVWAPAAYLSGPAAPLVLTVGLRRRDPSPRWKEVVSPRPGRFTHHLELWAPGAVDDEVRAWLREAWAAAG